MNAMVPGLAGSKMSSSDPNSKIDFLDPPNVVKKKINNAFCEEGNVAENGVLAFSKVLISISRLRMENIAAGDMSGKNFFVAEGAPSDTIFSIARPDKYGGPLHYSSFEDMETDFAAKRLHPGDLKLGVIAAINTLLEPVRMAFKNDPEFQQAALNAYPPDVPPAKEAKKKKVCQLRLSADGMTLIENAAVSGKRRKAIRGRRSYGAANRDSWTYTNIDPRFSRNTRCHKRHH